MLSTANRRGFGLKVLEVVTARIPSPPPATFALFEQDQDYAKIPRDTKPGQNTYGILYTFASTRSICAFIHSFPIAFRRQKPSSLSISPSFQLRSARYTKAAAGPFIPNAQIEYPSPEYGDSAWPNDSSHAALSPLSSVYSPRCLCHRSFLSIRKFA